MPSADFREGLAAPREKRKPDQLAPARNDPTPEGLPPAVVPAFASIEWTVRNHGADAEQIGDLGHRNSQATGLEATEAAVHFGRHFMDCVIRVHGSVYALRRVPVHVRLAPPLRNPPRPAWTKLHSIRNRR